ncbi:MAG: ScpA family protein [Methanocellales archaeon]|nr:ScpA family protein [Methanocellales archaeon]MDD3420685.1 ScpA family protein [Methanocellales archaeon]MDD4897857.1 ScpA family protein [Methanocellales archaeon]MDD5447380.1 ScpA family protein [Methanocellales archaeon]
MDTIEPVEILVELASKGEIDPWNIDIIDVTDKFLKKLEELKQLDLRVSGRTLLYASMLLRMKSEVLIDKKQEDEDFEWELFGFQPDYFQTDEYPSLHPRIRRESKRPVTLSELIDELKKAMDRKERSNKRRLIKVECMPTPEDVLKIAHEEDIEGMIQTIRSKLNKKFQKQDRVMFDELIEERTPSCIIRTYVPLLFMADRKQIWLEQKELFGDLYVKFRHE